MSSPIAILPLALLAALHPVESPSDPALFDGNHPRAFFFRSCEGGLSRRGMTYGKREADYDRLMGKALDEEVIGGVNQYGIGLHGFARQLRSRLGDRRIIQGDGALGPAAAPVPSAPWAASTALRINWQVKPQAHAGLIFPIQTSG